MFIYCAIYGQLNVDSLREVIASQKEDTSKVMTMGKLIYELSYGDKEEAQDISDAAMALAQELNFKKGIANINDLKGIIHLDLGNLDSAQSFFIEALKYYEAVNDNPKIFTSYQKLGQVHGLRNSFDIAKDYYDKAFDIAVNLGDERLIGNAYNSLGSFFINQGWYFGDNYNDSIRADSSFNLSIPYLKNAVTSFEKVKYTKGIALAYANMAIIHKQTGNLQASKQSMKRAEEYFDKMGFKIYLVSAYNHLNKIYQQEKQYDSAIYYVGKSLQLAKDIDSKFDLRNAYGQYSYIYQELGDYEKYIEYHSLYDNLNAQILDKDKQAIIDELEVKYKSESQQQQLAIQKAENERQKLILIIVIVVVVSLILLISFLIRKNIREKHLKKILIQQTEELKSINEEMSTQRDQLAEANLKLQEVNVEQSNIMAVVAHDLRSPLNKIKGLAGVMEMTDLSIEQKEINNKTANVTDEGLELIVDIMKLKEYESDFKLNLELLDVNDLLKSTVNEHQSYASRKSIELQLQIQEGIDQIITDKILISRIMDNLLSNAIKFSDENSKVDVNCRSENDLIIEITDEGPGFTEEDMKHVFKSFKKLSARPTAGENSSGLGLSIVKTLVDKLNGNVEIETEIGKGSTFRLTFPVDNKLT